MKQIHVKDISVMRPLMTALYHPKMWYLFRWWYVEFDERLVVTSTFRPGDNGVHGTNPCRGLDLRANNTSQNRREEMEAAANKAWTYDPRRPGFNVCKLHGKGKNVHFHLQVHDETVLSEILIA